MIYTPLPHQACVFGGFWKKRARIPAFLARGGSSAGVLVDLYQANMKCLHDPAYLVSILAYESHVQFMWFYLPESVKVFF